MKEDGERARIIIAGLMAHLDDGMGLSEVHDKLEAEFALYRAERDEELVAAARDIISATEPIAIADEHGAFTDEGYATINENTRKAIVKYRKALAALVEGVGK